MPETSDPSGAHSLGAQSRSAHRRALFLACVGVGLSSLFSGATTHLPALFLRAGVMGLALWGWPRPQARLGAAASIALAALALACGWGAWQGPAFGLAVQPSATLVTATMVFVALRHATGDAHDAVREALFALGSLHALVALAQRASLTPGIMHRATGGFFSPIDLAAFLAPLALWAWAEAIVDAPARARSRWMHASQAGIMTAGLLATSSRGGVLAFNVGLFISAAAWLRSTASARLYVRKHARAMAAVAITAGLGLIAATGMALRYRFNTAYDADAFSRIEIWRACLHLLAEHPWGLGTGNLEDAMRLRGVPTANIVRYLHVANNAHNTFLQTAVESGVAGVAAWVVFFAAVARSTLCRLDAALHWHSGIGLAFVLPALSANTWQLCVIAIMLASWMAYVGRRNEPAAAAAWAQASAKLSWPVGSRGLWGAIALCMAMALFPSALSSVCLLAAQRARSRGEGTQAAQVYIDYATQLMPWSVNTAMAGQALRAQGPQAPTPLAQAEALVGLAERFAQSPEPLRRAAQLLEAVARSPDQYTQVSSLWRMAVERDPHNALFWLHAARAAAKGHVPSDAPELFAQARLQEPHCAGAWLWVAQTAHAQNDTKARDAALEEIILSAQHAPKLESFARNILTLDADERVTFNALMHETKGAL